MSSIIIKFKNNKKMIDAGLLKWTEDRKKRHSKKT